MQIFHVLLMTLALIMGTALSVPTSARAQGAFGSGTPNIAARLVAQSHAPAAGRDVSIAFAMAPAPGWHGYWENPGDAGLGMTVKWTLPPGVTARALRYPVPETLMIAGLMNHVYEGPYAVLSALTLAPGLAKGMRLPIRARADWLACTDTICVPEGADLAIDLVVGEGAAGAGDVARFDAWRARLPRPLGSEAIYAVEGGRLRLSVPFPAEAKANAVHLFPLTEGFARYAADQKVIRNGDRLLIETVAGAGASGPVKAVLRTGAHSGFLIAATPGKVAAVEQDRAQTLLIALGAALLGGLLLNIMPCVFPILGLKAMKLARAGGDERAVRREALAYAAGVMLACVALGATLLALRAAGIAAGWAFQLQDPRIILLLLLLVTAIAFNLAGLFDLRGFGGGEALAGRGGMTGAFWTGALVAFVATPCTGPFMGAAMGAALVLPLADALAVFAGLGLGLALPFLIIAHVPPLRARLPRPGAWMIRAQKLLSLPMFATAIGLAWLLGQQRGVAGMTVGLACALALALALWWLGLRQRAARGGGLVAALSALAVLGLGLALLPTERPALAATRDATIPFDDARLADLRRTGKPVFLYFTADWCLTCKANEAAAIDRAETRTAFARAGVQVMMGDWTSADPAITRFLEGQGRSGVPLYLWYAPGREGQVLPQLLTSATLTDLVR
ncbi:protein-disulfide reductase DsbD domain-containing protein [Sphingobium sp. AN641]|uniref:protein-disulfide reductase DsbD family protein n=1 Tax=Sphingobium sp. AN641 TaxID=3133443 RepID=UPI0030BEA0BE